MPSRMFVYSSASPIAALFSRELLPKRHSQENQKVKGNPRTLVKSHPLRSGYWIYLCESDPSICEVTKGSLLVRKEGSK